MTRTDYLIVVALGILAVTTIAWRAQTPSAKPAGVQVQLGGITVGEYPLLPDEEKKQVEIEIPGGRAILSFEQGGVRILPLSRDLCPQGICAHQGLIRRPGETLVCAPNRLVVRILGGEGPRVDAVAR